MNGYGGGSSRMDDVSGEGGGRSYGLDDDVSSAAGSESVSQHFRKTRPSFFPSYSPVN
jgi:hypothetical protein